MKTIKWRNKKWRSFYNPKDFNPEDRWNITPCDKLRWIPPQTVAVATFEPVKVIKKKKKINQTPCYYQSQIQSWMCWFQRPIREAFSPNIRLKSKLLKMEMSLHRTESHQQSTSKSWRERLLHKGDCLNVHAEKTECYDQQAMQRLSKDKQKAQKQEGCVG
jgi:hypothetical protein